MVNKWSNFYWTLTFKKIDTLILPDRDMNRSWEFKLDRIWNKPLTKLCFELTRHRKLVFQIASINIEKRMLEEDNHCYNTQHIQVSIFGWIWSCQIVVELV